MQGKSLEETSDFMETGKITKSDREDMNPAERKAVVREVTALARDLRKNKRYKDD